MSPLGAKVNLMKPLQTLKEEHREHKPLLQKDSEEVMFLIKSRQHFEIKQFLVLFPCEL